MATVKLDRIIDLTKYINSSDYKFVGTSPGLHIFPNPGMIIHYIKYIYIYIIRCILNYSM